MRLLTSQITLCLLVLVTSTLAFHVTNLFPDLSVDAHRTVPPSNRRHHRCLAHSARHNNHKKCRHGRRTGRKHFDQTKLAHTQGHLAHRNRRKKPATARLGKKRPVSHVDPNHKRPEHDQSNPPTIPTGPTLQQPESSGVQVPETPAGKTPPERQIPDGKDQVSEIQALALEKINEFRALHNAPPLQTSLELVQNAVEWTSKCHYGHTPGAFTGAYGEIIARTSGWLPGSMSEAIKLWTVDEEKDFDPKNPQVSHFTQAVWKGSRYLGCASSDKCNNPVDHSTTVTGDGVPKDEQDSVLYICRFLPAGNLNDRAVGIILLKDHHCQL
ncbi:BZ3500_MvSof-1268-A1-R1_Chr2-2g04914 [Microbotryum saponariae]|uniref:BZ3500_MvSof-1268-A1-R1_Chr2-2g04914 protein n=1 Tax=Microbotryum saponariae TaxID=289078 RepID=A0A2X0K881_9BASI|nr:BZ3500_MvSof-1268-A1-R1_Chr2-2g04914 [Microbotryum saponariae]SDA00466.1 BZ3501_MvSof-1269-A2-R1_Chr2-2g04588 [Microbotryum saponariae]